MHNFKGWSNLHRGFHTHTHTHSKIEKYQCVQLIRMVRKHKQMEAWIWCEKQHNCSIRYLDKKASVYSTWCRIRVLSVHWVLLSLNCAWFGTQLWICRRRFLFLLVFTKVCVCYKYTDCIRCGLVVWKVCHVLFEAYTHHSCTNISTHAQHPELNRNITRPKKRWY